MTAVFDLVSKAGWTLPRAMATGFRRAGPHGGPA
jgi:hypothetical protein